MSHKAKNLEYEMREPTFLRRLRQQHAGDGGPDRYIAPRNKKVAVEDDEDAPAYVLEGAENETISKKEFEAMTSGKGEVEVDESKGESSQKLGEEVLREGGDTKIGLARKEEDVGRIIKENVTEVGVKGKKKRKATKIGGDDETEDKEEKIEKGKSKLGGKSKKRVVKLSFDEE